MMQIGEKVEAFVKLPMTTSLCGKTQKIDLTIQFRIEENGNFEFDYINGEVNGQSHDMSHLSHTHGVTLVELILGNRGMWNVEDNWYRHVLDGKFKLVG